MITLGFSLEKTHRVKALLQLLSAPDSPEIEFLVLHPETLKPDPYRRGLMTKADLERAREEFRKLLGLSVKGTDSCGPWSRMPVLT